MKNWWTTNNRNYTVGIVVQHKNELFNASTDAQSYMAAVTVQLNEKNNHWSLPP
jgi:hypothetical protein